MFPPGPVFILIEKSDRDNRRPAALRPRARRGGVRRHAVEHGDHVLDLGAVETLRQLAYGAGRANGDFQATRKADTAGRQQ
jgi:hypothetical protein